MRPERLDRALGLERLDHARARRAASRAGRPPSSSTARSRSSSMSAAERAHRARRGGAEPGALGIRRARPRASRREAGGGRQAVDAGVADAAPRLVDDAPQRDLVGRVVEHAQVRHRVLDLGALVEARAADHLVGHAVADEQVLEHARLRVRAVEDRDVARRSSRPRCRRADARRDDARLVVLVLGLDHADRLAVAELAPEPLLDAVPRCAR